MQRRISESRIILTGASSGIGLALAHALAREGAKLVLTARREEPLYSLARDLKDRYDAPAIVVPGDITSEPLRKLLVDTAVQVFGGIDILINNAGVGATALVEATSPQVVRLLADVNWFAVVDMIQRVIPELKKSALDSEAFRKGRRPLIVNLASVVGLRGTPHYGIYGGMKAAVVTMSDALRAELKQDRIDVLLVSPGTTQTEFFSSLLENRSMPNLPNHRSVSPEYVAGAIVRAMKKGRHRIVPHFESRILSILHRINPRLVDWIMSQYR